MNTVSASEFKAKCLAILDDVQRSGETIVITKRGRPVAQLSPAAQSASKYPQNELFGTVEVVGDVVGPPLPPDAWDVEQDLEDSA
jgi:prevent-host-death family protein